MSDSIKAFEDWAKTKGKFKPLDFLIACDGRYSGDQLQSSFNGWQASRQALEGDPAAYTDHGNLDLLSKGAPTTVFPECDKGKLVHAVPLYTHPACVDVPEEWKLVPRLSTESMELAARDWGIPNITPDEAGEVWDAMVEAIPEPPKITDAVASVPKGWTIEPFDDGFGVEGISVLWPDKRGGVHLRANDPKNSIAQNLLYDLAEALLCGSHPASVDVPDAEYIRALQDACDIIQADANTERNYGSLCRIGSVLVKLKDVHAKADDWIKCSERLPVERCLAFTPTDHEEIRYRIVPDRILKALSDTTHWMPLPEPPKQELDE